MDTCDTLYAHMLRFGGGLVVWRGKGGRGLAMQQSRGKKHGAVWTPHTCRAHFKNSTVVGLCGSSTVTPGLQLLGWQLLTKRRQHLAMTSRRRHTLNTSAKLCTMLCHSASLTDSKQGPPKSWSETTTTLLCCRKWPPVYPLLDNPERCQGCGALCCERC